MNIFLSGYDNIYNDSPYDEGYLDALCMLDQFGLWTYEELELLRQAKETIKGKVSE